MGSRRRACFDRRCRLASFACFLLLTTSACGDDDVDVGDSGIDAAAADAGPPDAGPPPEPRADYFAEGPHPVGNQRFTLEDADRGRTLPVEIWYPADESARAAADMGQPLSAFEAEAPRSDTLAGLLADVPDCVRSQTRSADAPSPAAGPWPLVVFSHCHACTRFDVASVAERLASFGIAVAAPDHEGNTLWDLLAGDVADVGETFLEVRVADVRFVLDALLGSDGAVPVALAGRFDADRVGVMGHSFGGSTAGITAARDERVRAGLSITAPLTALGGGAPITTIDRPFLFLLAQEDNSIQAVGNELIRNEHRRIPAPAVLVEVADAGHWSFSDYPGLIELFDPGCGMGTRQIGGDEFTYLDPDVARDVAADVAAAFFAVHLLGDPGGLTPVLLGHPSGQTVVQLNGR